MNLINVLLVRAMFRSDVLAGFVIGYATASLTVSVLLGIIQLRL